MLRLAFVSTPHQDESLVGYLYRLARLNALTGSEVLGAFRTATSDDVQHWTGGRNCPAGWADMVLELRQPSTRSARPWNWRSLKFCPHCLKEANYWRASWNLMLVTCCTRHRVTLQDSCSVCGRKLIAEAMRDSCCTHCGQQLANTSAALPAADAGTLWLVTQLEGRLSGRTKVRRHPAAHLSLNDLHELVLRFGVRSVPSERAKPLKLQDAGAMAIAGPVTAIAGQLLMTWPGGLFCLLDSIRSRRAQQAGWKINQAVGPLYQDIYRRLNGVQFDFVRAAFEDYLRDRWEAPLALRNRNLSSELIEEHRWVSLNEAAKTMEVDSALLKRLVAQGKIASREYSHGSGRTGCVVDLETVKVIVDSLKKALTLEQVGKILALSQGRVRQLVEAGLLVPMGGRPRAGERWWIDPLSVDSCAVCTLDTERRLDQTVSVAQLAQFRIKNGKEFVALVRAIHSGKLHVVGYMNDPKQVGSWLLNDKEVSGWLSRDCPAISSRIPVPTVAKELGVKQEVAYAIIRAGLLHSVGGIAGRHRTQWVTSTGLQRFRKCFVFGSELALELRTSAKALRRQLGVAGFIPVAGPNMSDAKCRQYVWRRTQKLTTFVTERTVVLRQRCSNNQTL